MNKKKAPLTYWQMVFKRFRGHKLGMVAFGMILLFCFIGVYAPFFASSKPIVIYYDHQFYFPLFRYLFYKGYYTKIIDLFFNLLMFTLPLFILTTCLLKSCKTKRRAVLFSLIGVQAIFFGIFSTGIVKDPAADPILNRERQQILQQSLKERGHTPLPDWNFKLHYMNDYAKLNRVLKYQQRKEQHEKFLHYKEQLNGAKIPSLYQIKKAHRKKKIERLNQIINKSAEESRAYQEAAAQKQYMHERAKWLIEQEKKIYFQIMPLIRPFHWEEDAGGDQRLNRYVDWWELTRVNRKDLLSALIFGIRVSLVVGITAVALALAIGVPIGAFAGYYGGTFDIIVSRLLEIWESMPTFFMLLLVVAITQSKSIFLIITVIGLFGWTSFSRYIRGEFFKQRNLSYVEACKAQGFHNRYIIFTHILPNAIPPLLTLLPFAIMGAITSEAGLSFLGLGEEGSSSWGVLMDEGRGAFPAESYLLWPPAILLTLLLIAIALVGDAMRDALDPKSLR